MLKPIYTNVCSSIPPPKLLHFCINYIQHNIGKNLTILRGKIGVDYRGLYIGIYHRRTKKHANLYVSMAIAR